MSEPAQVLAEAISSALCTALKAELGQATYDMLVARLREANEHLPDDEKVPIPDDPKEVAVDTKMLDAFVSAVATAVAQTLMDRLRVPALIVEREPGREVGRTQQTALEVVSQ